MEWMNYSVVGNEVWRLILFFIIVLLSSAVGRLARYSVDRIANRPATGDRPWRPVVLKAVARPFVLLGLAIGIRLGVSVLLLGEALDGIAGTCGTIATATAIGYAIYSLVDIVDHYLREMSARTESRLDDVLAPLVGKSIRITVMVLVVMNVVQEISGKSITTILAGLGVGGLAIALAGQDTIKNFFGSIVILGDRPFEIGDRIVIDGHDGPVESVGFRSTRIRTLDGHLVTVPNSEMVNRTVQNIGRRPYIRRVANITITYDTPPAKVALALDILKEILHDHEGMHPDFPARVFFDGFNDSSLNLVMIYWYHPPEYWDYMAFTERVNMQILKRFNAEGIEFAFPTQSIYLAGASSESDVEQISDS
ncbi:MAG: mechanosensitive ion channel family protein [Kiritimatiellia bacterium]|jgi:MscS family membrane protein|nr:mechanosensitive ion channel family protein [Kiritimatiellia bacterium]MDP6631568.1 mechanosensitive ion channel family protein [Kiritimatiellia bacterium]MDP6810674.1 mechanosensitive ion channel family protein [Kiritimatiellia bacterium]MDP7023760.1 mechanosensitive ion channel family protein [Kiritimatiellia bacterium]